MKTSIYALIFLLIFTSPAETKTIGIFAYTPLVWDPDTVNEGMGGSEEAVIYMSQELAQLGNNVIVYAKPPTDSKYRASSANPRFVDFHEQQIPLDVAIIWRYPELTLSFKHLSKKIYLWPHDTLCHQINDFVISSIDDVLWLSQWQRSQWIKMCPQFQKYSHIFGNGILPNQFSEVTERNNPYSCIYGSNYGRGLSLLLQIWPQIKTRFPKATLDIYYGCKTWGVLSKTEEEEILQSISSLEALDVKEHGRVGQEELNKAYNLASLWTYPCVFPETYCITALRAQASGAIPVVIKGTALHETVKFGYETNDSDKYLELLLHAMENISSVSLNERKQMAQETRDRHSWKQVALQWNELFNQDLKLQTIQ